MKKLYFTTTVIFIIACLTGFKAKLDEDFEVPETWPTLQKSESDFRSYYDANVNNLDPIEGIYDERTSTFIDKVPYNNTTTYRIAIVRSKSIGFTEKPEYDFAGFILESENKDWTIGRAKCYFRPTAYKGIYDCTWYNGRYEKNRMQFTIKPDGVVFNRTEETKYKYVGNQNPYLFTTEMSLVRAYPLFK